MSAPVQVPPRVDVSVLADPSRLPALDSADLEAFWEADDCPPHMMRLLTVQAVDACRTLAEGRRLTGTASHVADGDVAAYAWMSVQLERLGWQVEGAPLWAWARVAFEELVGVWPAGATDDIVVLVVDVPLGRTVLSAFDPWQELLDEGAEGTPGSKWARCLDIDQFPDSALQATMPFLEPDDVVRACRLSSR